MEGLLGLVFLVPGSSFQEHSPIVHCGEVLMVDGCGAVRAHGAQPIPVGVFSQLLIHPSLVLPN